MKRKWIIIAAAIAVAVVAVVLIVCLCGRNKSHALPAEEAAEEETVELLFGIDKQRYDIEQGIVREGETAGQILARYGVGAGTVDRIAKAAEPVFSLKNIRFGKPFTVFREKDSTSRLAYFVYEPTATDYLIVDLSGDSVDVRKNAKEVTVERRMKTATIESSLWNCMIDNGMSPNLAMELSEIYAWSIDFFGLQKGDNFTIIYDQQFVDSTEVGHGTIWGARFEHGGKTYYRRSVRAGRQTELLGRAGQQPAQEPAVRCRSSIAGSARASRTGACIRFCASGVHITGSTTPRRPGRPS